MNKIGTVNPWALLAIGAMICLTLLALVGIITGAFTELQAESSSAEFQQTAQVQDQQYDEVPAGLGCHADGGGCGCGG